MAKLPLDEYLRCEYEYEYRGLEYEYEYEYNELYTSTSRVHFLTISEQYTEA
jgi:hypothetical protein